MGVKVCSEFKVPRETTAGCQRYAFSCTCTFCRMVPKSPSPLARLLCRHIGVLLSTPLLPAPCLIVSEIGPHNLPSLGTLLHVRSRTQLSTGSKKQATSPFLIKPKTIDIPWLLRTYQQCTHGMTHGHKRNNKGWAARLYSVHQWCDPH